MTQYIQYIIVGAIVALAIAYLVHNIIKKTHRGGCDCDGACKGCPKGGGQCHCSKSNEQ